jgi:mRNA interferase RelE/StbE
VYEVNFTRQALKSLKALDGKIKDNLLKKIKNLSVNPYSTTLDVKKLKVVEDAYRLRVGGYRVIYEISNKKLLITVVQIGIRGGVYGQLR